MVKNIKISDEAHKVLTKLKKLKKNKDETYSDVVNTLLKENIVNRGLLGMVSSHVNPTKPDVNSRVLEGGYKQVAEEIGVDHTLLYKDMIANPENYPFIIVLGKGKRIRVLTERYEAWLKELSPLVIKPISSLIE